MVSVCLKAFSLYHDCAEPDGFETIFSRIRAAPSKILPNQLTHPFLNYDPPVLIGFTSHDVSISVILA